MKSKLLTFLIVFSFFITCNDREWDNPFDSECPKGAYSPSGLEVVQEGKSVRLSWQQGNQKISGFIIFRSESNGPMAEVVRLGKNVTNWNDINITGGKKYDYQVIAYAGENQSNPATAFVTTAIIELLVSTSATEATSCTSATSGGTIPSDGGGTITAKGVCWSTTQNPTVSGSRTTDGTGTSAFTSSITGLAGSTTYYVRAYATNSAGTAYGAQVSFTTPACPVVPTVTTSATSATTCSTVSSGGNVTSDGNATVTARGVCWSTSQNPTTAGSKTSDGSGTGSFTSSLTGLTGATTYYVRAYAVNSQGTAYGPEVSFTTPACPAVLPTILTGTTVAVTCASATSGGTIPSDGGGTITAKGVCWSTTQNPTVSGSKTTDGTGTSAFTSSITGLAGSTTYYVRAYATNSAGTAYGTQVSFTTPACPVIPSVTTSATSANTCTTAGSGGNVTSDGGTTVTARGVCWSTSQNPTTAGNKTSDGSGTGSFTSSLTGLTGATTYYVRAYAVNSQGTAYGPEVSFTTPACPAVLPTVMTGTSVVVSCSTASSGGTIPSDGGGTITAKGVCWSTAQNPTVSDSKTSDGTGNSAFTSSITGLAGGTTYYVRAYATNSAGSAYGTQVSFTTPACPAVLPTVMTGTSVAVSCSTASSGGTIPSDGGGTITAKGVCWSTAQNPTVSGSKTSDGTGNSAFTSSITGLAGGTTYYVRAYATNSAGTAYGTQVSFTTPACPAVLPIVMTGTSVAVSCSTASSGGNVTSDGNATVTTRGVCWGTSQNPTTANSKTSDGAGTGSFTSSLTGLTGATTYYVRAYAVNSQGTAYGPEVSFTTPDCPAVLPTVMTGTSVAMSCSTASSGGTIPSDGGGTITDKGVCWSTTQNPTVSGSKTTDGTGTSAFTSSIAGLSGSTTYYVRAYATNSAGTAYGTQVSFTTPACPMIPTVTTSATSATTCTTASSGGNVTSDGNATVTARGVCWSTSQNPTTAGNKTSDGAGTGSFTSSLTGLTGATTYYVRAYAVNSQGTAYGPETSFTTPACATSPTVTLSATSATTCSTASSGGDVTSDGGATVTARGVCWSTSANPTIADNKSSDGTGVGIFNSNITGLTGGTTYFVRAYATNSMGTAYSTVTFSFTTPQCNEGTFVDSRDNHTYKWVRIGTQIWMAENLAYLPSVNPPTQYSTLNPYFYVWGYGGTNVTEAKAIYYYQVYGALYNWPAAMQGAASSNANPSGVRGICPNGWHLPSDAEWKQLEMSLGMTKIQADATGSRGTNQGEQMKSTSGWLENGNGTNTSNFTALPGGDLISAYDFSNVGYRSFWWSSTEEPIAYAYFRELDYNNKMVLRNNRLKDYGFSIRCLKD